MLSASAVDRWADNWGDGLNPILVKETRQILKARLVAGSFLLVLSIAWFFSLTFVFQTSHPQAVLGPMLFARLITVLGIALFYVVPFISFRSMAAEREQHTFEMLSVTALSDRQIFWGKFCSALLLILLFEAAFAPFISMTYLLRGLSIFEIAAALIAITAMAMTLSLFGLMLGAVSKNIYWSMFNTFIVMLGSTIGAYILLALINLSGRSPDLFGSLCCAGFLSIFSGAFFSTITLSNLRPVSMGFVRTYLGRDDLPPITVAAADLAAAIEHEFPVKEESDLKTTAPVPISSAAYCKLLELSNALEQLLNPRHRDFAHLGRYRYLTIKGAAEPLEAICAVQNVILHHMGWGKICTGDVEQITIPDAPKVNPLLTHRVSELTSAAAKIQALLAGVENPEIEELGIHKPEAWGDANQPREF